MGHDAAETNLPDLFAALCVLDDESRHERLAAIERNDPSTASQLRALLEADLLFSNTGDGSPESRVAPSRSSFRQLSADQRIGPYRLIQIVGSGAMGHVWKARADWEVDVALKVLRPELLGSRSRRRFEREGSALRRLSHPNLVACLDVGEEGGIAYLVQELIPGGVTLRDSMTKALAHGERSPQAFREMADLIAQTASAMREVHEAGVIHRDLKPENILMTSDGVPKVADFGLAMLEGESGLTRTGDAPGTPRYMSPEQFLADELTERTDIFSLGAVLFELLALRPVFDGASTLRVREQALHGEILSPRQFDRRIPIDLATVCSKCLERSPERRYASMSDLEQDLRRFLAGQSIVARPAGVVRRAGRHLLRHRAAWIGITIVAAFVLAGAAYWSMSERTARLERTRAIEEFKLGVDEFVERAAVNIVGGEVDLVSVEAESSSMSSAIVGNPNVAIDLRKPGRPSTAEYMNHFATVGMNLEDQRASRLRSSLTDLIEDGARDSAFMGLMLLAQGLNEASVDNALLTAPPDPMDAVLAGSDSVFGNRIERVSQLMEESIWESSLRQVWKDWKDYWTAATPAVERVLMDLPEDAPSVARYWRSLLILEFGDPTRASEVMLDAVHRDEGMFAAHYYLARTLTGSAIRSTREVRIPHAMAAVALRKGSSRAWYQLGWVCFSVDDAEAKHAFQRAFELEPTLVEARANFALLAHGDEREQALEEAIKINPPGLMAFRMATSIHPKTQRRLEIGIAGLEIEGTDKERDMLLCNLGKEVVNVLQAELSNTGPQPTAAESKMAWRERPQVVTWMDEVLERADAGGDAFLRVMAHNVRVQAILAGGMRGVAIPGSIEAQALPSAKIAYELSRDLGGAARADAATAYASTLSFLERYDEMLDLLRDNAESERVRSWMRGLRDLAVDQVDSDPVQLKPLIQELDALLAEPAQAPREPDEG